MAELAATGRSNKEIAAKLFTDVSTVEAHLARLSKAWNPLACRARDADSNVGGCGSQTGGVNAPKLGVFRFRAPYPEP